MSTASRQILTPDDAVDPVSAVRPPLREARRDLVALQDQVVQDQGVQSQVDWAPFESPWRAPQALLDLIGASTPGQRPHRLHR